VRARALSLELQAPQALSLDRQERQERQDGLLRTLLASWARLAVEFGASGRVRLLAVCALLPVAGCSKHVEQGITITYTAPNCALGFEALKAKIIATPGLVQAPKDAGEPYEWFTSADQATSYVITEKGAPGHPAIIVQHAAAGRELTTGCPYGDKAGYAKVLAYVESLKGAHK
jgi:hypothetical protein